MAKQPHYIQVFISHGKRFAKDYQCSIDGCENQSKHWWREEPVCNKHYLRLLNHGSALFPYRKKKTRYIKHKKFAEGITSSGKRFLFSLKDWQIVTKNSWTVSKTGYCVANINHKVIKLHRLLMKPSKDKVVDHINGNRLDNRRENLRIITRTQNDYNHKARKTNITGICGVVRTKSGKYKAQIGFNYKHISLGTFNTLQEAKEKRLKAERRMFGEYGRNSQKTQ